MNRLRGVRLKLDRADQHLQGLNEAISEYVTDNRERFRGEFQADPPVYEFKGESVSFRAFDGFRWSPIIGDAVHNLHAVLDYLVCQLTLANGKDVCTSTGFPVFASEAHWLKAKAPSKFKDVAPAAKAAIESLQPFKRRDECPNPSIHPLKVLYDLEQWDKHRMLHVALSTLHFWFDGLPDNIVGDLTDVPLGDGPERKAVYARMRHDHWPDTIDKSKVEVYLYATRSVVFDPAGPAGGTSVRDELMDARAFIADVVIPELERFLR